MSTSRRRVEALLGATSFALLGASDKSPFSRLIFDNLVASGRAKTTYLINRRSPEVHGQPTYPDCRSVGRPIDLAVIMVPAPAVADAVRDAAIGGARAAVLLSSGFAEAGPEGRARQSELIALAEQLDLAILGPNVLGFIDVGADLAAITLARPPRVGGNVALISQSGASCAAMLDFAALAGVGLSHVFTVGNEAMITVGDLIDYLVDQPKTRAIAVFLEAIRDPARFAVAVHRAAAADVALVVLKAGRSALAARVASAHTGALVGNDRVIEAVLERLRVIRVDTIEDMLVTAGLAAYTGALPRPGLGVVSVSGGACDIVADLAEPTGAVLPELAEPTQRRLSAVLPDYGQIQNPLDVTGAAVLDPRIFTEAVSALGNDPGIGAVAVVNSLPWRPDALPFYGQRYVDAIGAGQARAASPVVYLTQVTQPLLTARAVLDQAGVGHALPGLRLGLQALARVARWSGRRAGPIERVGASAPMASGRLPMSELDARALLEGFGVPVVPARLVRSASEAIATAADFGGRVAIKVVSSQISHKSDLGAVQLGVEPGAAGTAYNTVMSAAAGYAVDGALVAPMRAGGVELLVGVLRDPDWGLLLTVGLGGVLVEVLDDIALAPLPVTAADAAAMVSGLRGAAVLQGWRGQRPADVATLADAVAAISRLAESLADDLEALEVNPLLVDGGRVEALDALVEWRAGPAQPREPEAPSTVSEIPDT